MHERCTSVRPTRRRYIIFLCIPTFADLRNKECIIFFCMEEFYQEVVADRWHWLLIAGLGYQGQDVCKEEIL